MTLNTLASADRKDKLPFWFRLLFALHSLALLIKGIGLNRCAVAGASLLLVLSSQFGVV